MWICCSAPRRLKRTRRADADLAVVRLRRDLRGRLAVAPIAQVALERLGLLLVGRRVDRGFKLADPGLDLRETGGGDIIGAGRDRQLELGFEMFLIAFAAKRYTHSDSLLRPSTSFISTPLAHLAQGNSGEVLAALDVAHADPLEVADLVEEARAALGGAIAAAPPCHSPDRPPRPNRRAAGGRECRARAPRRARRAGPSTRPIRSIHARRRRGGGVCRAPPRRFRSAPGWAGTRRRNRLWSKARSRLLPPICGA